MKPIVHTIDKLDKNVTLAVEIRETPNFKIRKWIATRLLVLAALVLGCNLEIEDGEKGEQ